MNDIRAIGMVIYTYAVMEERLEDLWRWLQNVEHWINRPYAEFHFSPRAKESIRIWKATVKNRQHLYQRLRTEQPWFVLDFGFPAGTLRSSPYLTNGLDVAVTSRPQPRRGSESYYRPSYLYLEVHPKILLQSPTGISGFLELGTQAWQIVKGVYGFIDVETGIALQDDISRNAIHLFDSTVPSEYHQEFRAWQRLDSQLDKRVWKAFWGNFLNAEHLRRIGGLEEMRRADPHYRLLLEYQDRAYQRGVEQLHSCNCIHGWQALSDDGMLVTLSHSPLDWFEPHVQARRERLQEALGKIALSQMDRDENLS